MIVNVGVNNLRKELFYKNEFEQMTLAGCDLNLLQSSMLYSNESNKFMHIIFSYVTITQNSCINDGTKLINGKIKNKC